MSRKGVQAVLLPNWSDASVEKFLDVFRESAKKPCNKGPKEIEIAFLVWKDHKPTNHQGYWDTVRTIIDKLQAGGHTLWVTVHLSLHGNTTNASQPTHAVDGEVTENAKLFNDKLLVPYSTKGVNFALCPSLEDYTDATEFDRWAALAAGKLRADLVRSVDLRRSAMGTSHSINSARGFRATQEEWHGEVPKSAYAYSNDGNLVYYKPNQEDDRSLDGGGKPAYTLADFTQAAEARKHVTLLWRPAYNLLARTNGVYTKTGRDFGDKAGSFNDVEVAVLRKFLRIA